jgi:hypothetical protein
MDDLLTRCSTLTAGSRMAESRDAGREPVTRRPLLEAAGMAGIYDDKAVELDAHREHTVFTPFTAPDRRSVLDVEPERVAIQTVRRSGTTGTITRAPRRRARSARHSPMPERDAHRLSSPVDGAVAGVTRDHAGLRSRSDEGDLVPGDGPRTPANKCQRRTLRRRSHLVSQHGAIKPRWARSLRIKRLQVQARGARDTRSARPSVGVPTSSAAFSPRPARPPSLGGEGHPATC